MTLVWTQEWYIVKMPVQKGCNDRPDGVTGWIGHVSHQYLGSLLGVIELINLCAFENKVGKF